MMGFHGKILEVNLSNSTVSEIEVTEEMIKKFVGGAGLGAAMLYSRLTADLDPLSPEAPLAFLTGMFTGQTPFSGRHVIVGKSPLTRLWGESTSGGFFAVTMKKAGIDGIILTGRAEKPTYLFVSDGKVEFRDAGEIWGKSTGETIEFVQNETDKKARVACIGPAGENLVKYACIINDSHRAAGRTGMGAVMGSKNLKAIAVVGEVGLPDVADEAKLKEHYSALLENVAANPGKELWHTYGTLMYTTQGYELGDTPAKYFTEGVFPAFRISGEAMLENYEVKPEGCANCPVICGHRVRGVKMEYESVASLGSLCGIYDLDGILDATQYCNEAGLDVISAGVSVAFAMYLTEKGLLKDGVRFGDAEGLLEKLKKIVGREGLGEVLAEGTKVAAKKLGVSEEEAAQVKGLEVPMHDPRAFSGMALTYATSSRGACHLHSEYFTVDIGAAPVPELGVIPTNRFDESEEKVRMHVIHQSAKEMWNSYILCMLGLIGVSDAANFHSAITGESVTPSDVAKIGERTYMLKRMINLKLGMKKEDEKLPEIVRRPLKKGGTGGYSPNVKRMLEMYYRLRGLDDNGHPTKEKLEDLGLTEFS
nr:aldehyde ferredoxin oxidoreductase family protein [Archaeoglobus fulgidus]